VIRKDEAGVKKIVTMFGISVCVFLFVFAIYHYNNPKVQESITFFPIDSKVTYKAVQTSLSLMNKPPNTLLWRITSTLDREAYLRQDVGLLYSNGRLIGELREWKPNTAVIDQEKRLKSDKSSLLQAITFHHAELHEKGDRIFSSQAMSTDQLYVIHSNSTAIHSFKKPTTEKEIQWKEQLDERTERMLQLSWNKGVRHFSIRLSEYQSYPLSQFNEQTKNILPGFSKTETARIVGNLWEGLYKNYFLGIKKADGTSENPNGSTLPLILIATNKTHLFVLTETEKGEPILLRQNIKSID
jgi:hypothetical protein